MNSKITLTESFIHNLFQNESSKICGKCMKRFELSDNKEEIKKQIRELIYEFMRDLRDNIIVCGKESIHLTNIESKSKE